MKPATVILCIFLFQISCNNDTGSKTSIKDEMFCTIRYSDAAIKEASHPHLALDERYWWPHGTDMQLSLLVRFMNGTDFQQKKVIQYATEWDSASALGWNGLHKIHFIFVNNNWPPTAYTDIRIQFNNGGGTNSVIGSDCKNVPLDQATTVFGWVDQNHSEADIKSAILHELGHTLGLIHEHQNPTAAIKWNKQACYDYYRNQDPPWSPAEVDKNVINVYNASTTNYTQFDIKSIMCYAIPPQLTLDGYSTSWNYELSDVDKSFIKTLYPYYPCVVGETCCWDRKGKRIPCP